MRTFVAGRRAWSIRALCGVLAACLVSGWAPGAFAARARPPSQAAVAARLARQVTKARTPARRARALVPVMRALHVGVYRGGGRAVVRGAERSAEDLYVYDFTLKGVAQQMASGQTVTVAALAARLDAAMAPVKGHRAITARRLGSALRSTVRWARAHPRSPRALPSLLLREVVRRGHGGDLARRAPAAGAKLGALPAFLITVDFAAGMRDVNHRGGRARSAQAASVVGDLCGALKPLYTAYQASKLYQTLTTAGGIAAWAQKMLLKTVTVGFLNSWVIDQIRVTENPAGKILGNTHYGRASHEGGPEGGQPIRLGITVRMPPGLGGGEIFAKCGWLAAFGPFQSAIKVPPNGPLAGVPVDWRQDPDGASGKCVHFEPGGLSSDRAIASTSLLGHGTALFSAATDAGGGGWAYFVPKDEPLMGIGDYCLERGGFTASVDVQRFFGGGLLALSPNVYSLLPPKRVHFNWTVGYHRAKGYKISLSLPAGTLRDDYGYGFDDLTSVSAQACGSDPYATPWTATGTAVNHLGQSVTLSGTIALTAAGTWAPVEEAYRDGIVWELDMRIMDGSPAQMELRGSHNRTGTATAKIEENTACGG